MLPALSIRYTAGTGSRWWVCPAAGGFQINAILVVLEQRGGVDTKRQAKRLGQGHAAVAEQRVGERAAFQGLAQLRRGVRTDGDDPVAQFLQFLLNFHQSRQVFRAVWAPAATIEHKRRGLFQVGLGQIEGFAVRRAERRRGRLLPDWHRLHLIGVRRHAGLPSRGAGFGTGEVSHPITPIPNTTATIIIDTRFMPKSP
jgi:hypothetical protein